MIYHPSRSISVILDGQNEWFPQNCMCFLCACACSIMTFISFWVGFLIWNLCCCCCCRLISFTELLYFCDCVTSAIITQFLTGCLCVLNYVSKLDHLIYIITLSNLSSISITCCVWVCQLFCFLPLLLLCRLFYSMRAKILTCCWGLLDYLIVLLVVTTAFSWKKVNITLQMAS